MRAQENRIHRGVEVVETYGIRDHGGENCEGSVSDCSSVLDLGGWHTWLAGIVGVEFAREDGNDGHLYKEYRGV